MAWCAGMLSGKFATCLNMALRPLVIWSDTGVRPVLKEISELRTKSCHLIPRILRWHFMWKDSMAFMLLASKVHVLDTYSRIDRTSTTHYCHNCKSQRNYTVLYTEIHIDAQHITTLCLIKKIPNIFSCNSGMHSWILIIFGRNILQKVGNWKIV